MIDVEKLGYEYYKVEIHFSQLPSKKRFLQHCKQHPNIYQVDEIIGGSHIDIELHVKHLTQLHTIMNELEEAFQNSIRNYTYFRVLEEHKTTYYPT